tara:strand:- start:412 stop:654 length:243 start_codon:yes stop_codon:yes gene_type:complete
MTGRGRIHRKIAGLMTAEWEHTAEVRMRAGESPVVVLRSKRNASNRWNRPRIYSLSHFKMIAAEIFSAEVQLIKEMKGAP